MDHSAECDCQECMQSWYVLSDKELNKLKKVGDKLIEKVGALDQFVWNNEKPKGLDQFFWTTEDEKE